MLNYAKDSIIGGGGHAAAAGVKVEQAKLYQFREQINAYYQSLHLPDQSKYLKQHADLTISDFSELNFTLLDELKQLEPYGAGNDEPIFRLADVSIASVTRMGADRNHLRIDLKDKNGKFFKLIAFFAPQKWLQLDPTDPTLKIEPLVTLNENDFNGVKSVEARIVDLNILA